SRRGGTRGHRTPLSRHLPQVAQRLEPPVSAPRPAAPRPRRLRDCEPRLYPRAGAPQSCALHSSHAEEDGSRAGPAAGASERQGQERRRIGRGRPRRGRARGRDCLDRASLGGAELREEVAQKRSCPVILSEAKNLALRTSEDLRDSSSPTAPQNDSVPEFFSDLLLTSGLLRRTPFARLRLSRPPPARAAWTATGRGTARV